MSQVIIGVDPHKRSATIEIINDREQAVGGGRFATDRDGYKAMLAAGRKHADRLWAVEGCSGIGRHVAQRLVADGETVVEVPAKLSARARVFATGQGRKIDPVDARSVAVVALRTPGLRQVAVDDTTVALRLLVDPATSSAGPAPRSSPACTTSCWNSCPAARSSSCPRNRPAPCSTPADPAMWSARPAAGWRPS
ncbi:MAG TPA: transposase [Acidimicrobiales bacterium]